MSSETDKIGKCRDCDHRFPPFPDISTFRDFNTWSVAMARWSKHIVEHYQVEHQVEVPLLGAAANRVLSALN